MSSAMTNQNPPHHHHQLLQTLTNSFTSPFLLSLLPLLFSRHRFAAAKILLVSFISGDTHNHLHRLLLRFNSTKALLDTGIGAYLHFNRSHLVVQLFRHISRLRLCLILLILNTLLTSFSFISSDTHNHLQRILLRSNSKKALLNTVIGAYLHLT